jgi:hypothetical protein
MHDDPEFTDVHFNSGRLLERMGDIEGAREH